MPGVYNNNININNSSSSNNNNGNDNNKLNKTTADIVMGLNDSTNNWRPLCYYLYRCYLHEHLLLQV